MEVLQYGGIAGDLKQDAFLGLRTPIRRSSRERDAGAVLTPVRTARVLRPQRTRRRPPSTGLFVSTSNKLGDESELFKDLDG